MGERASTPEREDDTEGDTDPHAPWRPGYEGWDRTVERPDGSTGAPVAERPETDAPPGTEMWSREHDQRPKEPWQPEPRPPRRSPPLSDPMGSAGRPVVDVEGLPPSTSTGDLWLGAIAVALLCVAAVSTAVVLRPTRTVDVDRTQPLVPDGVDEAWRIEVGDRVDDIGVGADLVVVAVEGELIAVDADTGDVAWTAPVEGTVDRVTVVDQHVIVEARTSGGRARVRSLDAATGADAWTHDDDGVVFASGPDDEVVLFRRIQDDGDALIDVLDPATGEPVGDGFVLSGVTAAGSDLAAAPTERTVAIWSRSERAVVTEPVGAFNLRMAGHDEGRIVALDRERRVILFDETGRRLDETPFVSDAFGEFDGRARLVGVVPGERIAIVSSGSSIGYRVADDRLEPAWELDGRVESPVVTADGPFALLVGPAPGDGQVRTLVVDPADGSIVAVTDADGNREAAPILGHNAYVVAPTIGAPERRLVAHRYDGEELWSTDLPPGASYEVAHGALVVVEHGQDADRVSLHR